jgi:hypothetical protein
LNQKRKNGFTSGLKVNLQLNPSSPCFDLKIVNNQIHLIETESGITALINGRNHLTDIKFSHFFQIIPYLTNRSLKSIVIHQAPGVIIENQIFDGVNIAIFDSPYSRIINNTIKNLKCFSTENFVSGISLINSDYSIVKNNLIRNIMSEFNNKSLYGIYIRNCQNITLFSNKIDSAVTLVSSDAISAPSAYANTSIHGICVFRSRTPIIHDNIIKNLSSYARARANGSYTDTDAYALLWDFNGFE